MAVYVAPLIVADDTGPKEWADAEFEVEADGEVELASWAFFGRFEFKADQDSFQGAAGV